MASPPGSPGQTGWAELKSLRDSATFISEDILNYEPPSERRARLRARNDSQNSADNSVELSSSASNLQSSCSLEPGPGTPPFAKENAPESLPVASAESPEGAREGEFSATPSLYTWHLKCDVPAPNAAFRLTISGRSMVVTVGSTTQLGPDSVALLARRLVLPLDADLSELVASFHEGEVKIQIVRKGGGKSAQLSPGPVDTLALARNTEEMMAELSDMLELGFQQPAPAYGDDSAPARPLSDSALMRSPQKTTASELPRDDVMPPMSAERMPTIQSIDPDATAHSAIQSISLDNPHGKASDARFTMRHEPAAPHASVAPSKVPSAQRSGAPHASLTPQQVAPDFANQFTSPTATPSDQDKAVRAAQRRDQFLHSVDRDSAPTASHAEPNAAAEAAAPLSQSTGRNLNLKPQAPESDVLKRCQDLLKRSKEQSRELFDDVAWPLTGEAQARAAYTHAALNSAPADQLLSFPEHSMRGFLGGLGAEIPAGRLGTAGPGYLGGTSGHDSGLDDALAAGRMHMRGPRQSFDVAHTQPPAQPSSYSGHHARQPGQPRMMVGSLSGASGHGGHEGSVAGMDRARSPGRFADTGRPHEGRRARAQSPAPATRAAHPDLPNPGPHGQAPRPAPPAQMRDSRGSAPPQNSGASGVVFM